MGKSPSYELTEKLKLHKDWVLSDEKQGQQLILPGSDLSDLDLNSVTDTMAMVKLDHANLSRADLYYINLASASLNEVNLIEATLSKANLDYATLTNANLQRVTGVRASFHQTDLRGANLTEANLLKAHFSEADLRGANLTRANLDRTTFREADLRQAILLGASLENAFFSGTCLFGINLRGTRGIETIRVEWIDIGEEEPIRLEGEAAREWLRQAAETGDA